MSPPWRVPTPVRLNWQGRPMAVRVPAAVRSITVSLCSVPVRFAETVTPLAQFAETVPSMVDAVCAVMSHFTSEQLPSGRPAMVEEPQLPANADAAPVAEPPPVDDPPPVDPPVVVEPATPPVSEGAVGVKSFELCSNEQPVASIEASARPKKD